MMNRRTFLSGIAGLLSMPLAAEGQPAQRMPRIGVLAQNSPLWEAFRQGLRDLGYVEGRTITIEYRWGEGNDEQFPRFAADLVSLGVNAIVTWGTPATLAAKNATKTIPIVMAASGDPVGTGLIASLSHPGGNITGSSSHNPGAEAKRLQLLKEIVPKLSRVGVIWNPANPLHNGLLRELNDAAAKLGVSVEPFGVQQSAEFDGAFMSIDKRRPEALIVEADTLFAFYRTRIVEFTAKIRLPVVFTVKEFADVGGLVVYGASYPELFRLAATYVDKVLKGANPADLPVEQARKFELVINLKTAKALGLTIPPSLLLRADQVIQ